MIYIHIPFCKSFCTYCDFYSEICNERVQNDFLDSLLREIEDRRREFPATNGVRTLYFGGGTPSLLPVDLVERIVKAIDNGPYDEFTIEVNPEDVVRKGTEYIRDLAALGVNRISMGVQSMDDGILKWMNRRHTSSQAREAVRIIREAGIKNLSLDLIFGLSQLSQEMWADTLSQVLDLKPEHISAYQLSIEEGSELSAKIRRGEYSEASDDICREQYEILCKVMKDNGYHHYEISNFAHPGYEAIHNSAYWSRAPYVGLGPGAHSLIGDRTRRWNLQELKGWGYEEEILSDEEIREEAIMLGLRTDRGYEGKIIPESDWFVSDNIISGLI